MDSLEYYRRAAQFRQEGAMVDPVSLTTVLEGLLAGATGAAGGAAMSSLGGLLRRAVGREIEEVEIKRLLEQGPSNAEVIAGHLIDVAHDDETFARDLQIWLSAALVLAKDDSTTNSVSGTVTGTVIQGRDFNGPVNLP
jgi:hypothetical protein